ncbi:MAG: ABC transporter permease [Aristaeellaceae bacterium]
MQKLDKAKVGQVLPTIVNLAFLIFLALKPWPEGALSGAAWLVCATGMLFAGLLVLYLAKRDVYDRIAVWAMLGITLLCLIGGFLGSAMWLVALGLLVQLMARLRRNSHEMYRYVKRRILMFIPTLIIISVVIFFVIQLPPGDYATAYAGALAAEGEILSAEEIEALRQQFGLDDPWLVQYGKWVWNIITRGDFGYSFEYGKDVWAVIMERLYLTLGVSFVILVFQYGVSLPIGIYCANHQYSVGDYVLSFFGFIGTATPNFLLAIIIMYIIYVNTGETKLGLFSLEMMQNGMRWEYVPEFLGRCAIPLIVIGTSGTCGIIRTVRAQMLDEQARQYTLCARAKGCSEATITYKYCLRAALNPVVSGMSGSLRTIFSGSTVSAIVMNLAIQGPVLLKALQSQDMYLAGTIVLIQAVLVLVGTLLSDIALAWLDPRIRFSERS